MTIPDPLHWREKMAGEDDDEPHRPGAAKSGNPRRNNTNTQPLPNGQKTARSEASLCCADAARCETVPCTAMPSRCYALLCVAMPCFAFALLCGAGLGRCVASPWLELPLLCSGLPCCAYECCVIRQRCRYGLQPFGLTQPKPPPAIRPSAPARDATKSVIGRHS